MYMTSALSKNDMKAIGLQMALDLLAKKEKRDSITGLRTRTQPGRPEWSKVPATVPLSQRSQARAEANNVFAYFSHLNVSDHPTNYNIRQRQRE